MNDHSEAWLYGRPEFELIRLCARTQLSLTQQQQLQTLLETTPIDWQTVVNEAGMQNVLSLVYSCLASDPEIAGCVPSDVLSDLHHTTQGMTGLNLQTAFILRHIIDCFDREQIRALPYKGLTLTALAYRSLSLRSCGDLDILVHEQDIVRAKDRLLSLGYQPVASTEHQHLQKNDPGRSYQGYDLMHPKTGVVIDLQERPGVRYSSFQVDMHALWERRITVKIGSIELPTLCPEDCLLVLCAHGTQHRWQRLKWVCDLAELMRTFPNLNWDYVFDQAARLESLRMVYVGLILAHRYLDAPLPEAARRRVYADVVSQRLADDTYVWIFRRPEDLSHLVKRYAFDLDFDLRTRQQLRNQIRCTLFLIRRRVSPKERDRELVRLPRGLSFLYYVLRPVRILIAYGGYSLMNWRRHASTSSYSNHPKHS